MTATDTAARVRALTDLGTTLLVEAAAGTGKTALIAGRLTMLLANGCAPSNIAAITFTEPAASELAARVHRYVERLLEGEIPTALSDALPNGLSEGQRECLAASRARLEELTTSTIHGFCQTIIHSYAVEACIDPGAQVIDAVQAEIAFDITFDRWLRRRLATSAAADDPLVVLSREDPKHVVSTVRDLARFRRLHRTARPVASDLGGRPDIDLIDAVRAFKMWRSAASSQSETDALLGSCEIVARFYADSFQSPPAFEALWRLAHPPTVPAMYRNSFHFKRPKLKAGWLRVAGPTDGVRLHDEAMEHFVKVETCYRTLLGKVSTALVETLSKHLDEVLSDYADFKRKAALVDFDDLLYYARDLVRAHEPVRIALGRRYSRILVDEFQDTDPIQAEILFRVATIDSPTRWEEGTLRDGALFMVGDPKQAIYRFRGADVESYKRARNAVRQRHPGNILHITNNFRSQSKILAHVNLCFETPLSAAGQPGYVRLASTREDVPQPVPCVAKRTIELLPDSNVHDVRDAEAQDVAEICARLIGNMEVMDEEGARRRLLPADIGLLAPAGTELHRYEHALDKKGLPYSSQAGKNLFGRQEIQDLISLARALADPRDTLAFGALMRGPLVGLTEEEMLDITATLSPGPEQPDLVGRLNLLTDASTISHPVAREVLAVLRDLRYRAASTTPMLLLSEAIERLQVRPILIAREEKHSGRALANIDAFLELARAYDVRGLKHFVRNVSHDWAERESRAEGRVDAAGDAIDIVTIHSSKGLEWPVVILVNTVSNFRLRDKFIHRFEDDTIHWVLGDVIPPDLHSALERDDENTARERERLMYVAFTRARDLLVLPKVPHTTDNSWTSLMQGTDADLPELDLSQLSRQAIPQRVEPRNEQTAEIFAEQNRTIATAIRHVSWVRPSVDDLDREQISELFTTGDDGGVETGTPVGAGVLRGLILHKMFEEILTGELVDEHETLLGRARGLLDQVAAPGLRMAGVAPEPEELAATIKRALALPDIAPLRGGLVPEVSVFGTLLDPEKRSVAGRADAIFVENDWPRVVIDWKSDVEPSRADISLHAAQLRVYMRTVQVARGALVYVSSGRVHWLELEERGN